MNNGSPVNGLQLTASGLACRRGGRDVLTGVDFAVAAGGALVVTGPNGAGKSSLLRLIAGLLRPAGGELRLAGGEADLPLGEQCHLIGHLDPVKGALTVGENLQFWSEFLGGRPGLDGAAALDAVGLGNLDDLPGGYLSAGQRRRLSLARLLTVRRPIWLLDEPTSTLDSAGQEQFRTLVRDHCGAGGIAIAATHAPLGLDGAQELRLGGRR